VKKKKIGLFLHGTIDSSRFVIGMSSIYVINLVLKVLVSMKLNEVFGHRLDLIEIDGI
jgi:hypothetical protein